MFHDNLNHIDICYYYIRDMVQRVVLKLQYVGTDEHIAYVLTKPLPCVNFEYFQDNISVVQG
jgi:hypothetical protein